MSLLDNGSLLTLGALVAVTVASSVFKRQGSQAGGPATVAQIQIEIANWEAVLADALDLEEKGDATKARREIKRLRKLLTERSRT
jgi:hypothetical protein